MEQNTTEEHLHLDKKSHFVLEQVQEIPSSLETCLEFENLELKSISFVIVAIEQARTGITAESRSSRSKEV